MITPTFQHASLDSNRFNGLAADTLQVVCFYDGNNACAFVFEYRLPNGNLGTMVVEGIRQFDVEVKTAQYAMNGAVLTGNFWVKGVQANGVVDGLAFGLLWRDARGNFHIVRSNSAAPTPQACYVGAWPLGGWNATRFAQRAPQVTDGFAQETALAVICGAKLLPDGAYTLPVL